MKQVIGKDGAPEVSSRIKFLNFHERGKKHFLILFLVQEQVSGTVSAEEGEVTVKDELIRKEEEEVSTNKNELSTEKEQATVVTDDEQKVVSIEQPRTMICFTQEENITDVLVQENESLELSSAAEVAREECIEKDEQIEDVVSPANEATEEIVHEEDEDQSTLVEAPKQEPQDKESKTEVVGADDIIQDDIPNEKV